MSPPRKSKAEEQRAERARRDDTRHAPSNGPGEAPESDPGGDTLVSDATSPGPPVDAGEAADREVAGGSAITGHPSPASPPDLTSGRDDDYRADGVSLTLHPLITFASWYELMDYLQTVEESIGWYLGDAWNQGEDLFGEEAAAAVKDGYAAQTLINYASVCRAFPPDQRVEGLSIHHHAVVQTRELDDGTRRELLDRAVSERMSRNALIAAKKEALGKGSPNGEHPTHHVSEDGESDGPLLAVHQAVTAGHDLSPFSDELLRDAKGAARRVGAALESEFSRRAET